MEKRITIPQSITSTYEGYAKLLELFDIYLNPQKNVTTVITDFRANTWFEANLLPIVYAYIQYGKMNNNLKSIYENQLNSRLHDILLRNNFAKTGFQLEHKPRKKETVVPFKVFGAEDTYGFSKYIDAELIRYFSEMDDNVKKVLSSCVQGLFGNAQIHGNCNKVYTCGQYYHKKQKMDFTIVNLGRTIPENVKSYMQDYARNVPPYCIQWAVDPGNSTKRNRSGGIGLSLMKDFIDYNKEKYQIISGNEFWELNKQKITSRNFKYVFPGTIINIEIHQNDKCNYSYSDRNNAEHLF